MYTEGEGEIVGAYVFIKATSASVSAPIINKQPVGATYNVGDIIIPLAVSASGKGSVSYQWYINDAENTENGTAIEGATESEYTPGTTEEAGIKYYYCVVTNSLQGYTSSITSEIAKIEIKSVKDLIKDKLSGSGTQEDPYLIKTAEDYQSVA